VYSTFLMSQNGYLVEKRFGWRELGREEPLEHVLIVLIYKKITTNNVQVRSQDAMHDWDFFSLVAIIFPLSWNKTF